MKSCNISKLLQEDNQDGLKELYRVYYKPLLYFVMQYVKDITVSEDIVAETFVKIWEYRIRFNNLESIRSFLYITAKNSALNQIRRPSNKKEHINLTAIEDRIFEDSDVLNNIIRTELLKNIFDEVIKLPVKQQEVFRLIYIEDKTIAEICILLDMTENAVYTNRSRAITSLKKLLVDNHLFEVIILSACLK